MGNDKRMDEDMRQIIVAWKYVVPYLVRVVAFLKRKTVIDFLGNTYVIRDGVVINLGSYK